MRKPHLITDETVSNFDNAIHNTMTDALGVAPAGAAATPPELLHLAEPSSILRALECPICTYIALPPLVLCEHGHFVCESCRAQTSVCGLCKGQYTKVRAIAIEQIVRASIFSCRFRAEGCTDRVLGDEYKLHLEKCNFRNFTCNCYYGSHCQGVSSPYNKYIDHLLEHHKFETRNYDASEEGVPTVDFTSSMRGRVYEWKPLIIKYEHDKFFIARRRLLNDTLTIWLSLFGPDEDAADYHTEITICNSDPEVRVPCVKWTVAVHPCRKDWAEIDDSFLCVTIPFQQLKQIGSRQDGKLVWKIWFKIQSNQSHDQETALDADIEVAEATTAAAVDSDYESRSSPEGTDNESPSRPMTADS